MGVIVQTFQTALPIDLFERLQRIRNRYAAALVAAGEGDYSRRVELRSVSRVVGHILAQEAKKGPEQRGGMRMLDLSLAVDRFFPELRGWNQRAALERLASRLGEKAS